MAEVLIDLFGKPWKPMERVQRALIQFEEARLLADVWARVLS